MCWLSHSAARRQHLRTFGPAASTINSNSSEYSRKSWQVRGAMAFSQRRHYFYDFSAYQRIRHLLVPDHEVRQDKSCIARCMDVITTFRAYRSGVTLMCDLNNEHSGLTARDRCQSCSTSQRDLGQAGAFPPVSKLQWTALRMATTTTTSGVAQKRYNC